MQVAEAAVGGTPLVELDAGVPATVYGKPEWLNHAALPHGGSTKTRIARAMLDAAPDDLPGPVLEPSTGNTGRALARVGAARGLDVEIVLPHDAGRGKVADVRDAGATVHYVTADAYDAVLDRADELARSGDYYRPDQYANPANPGVHEAETGPEIWDATDGEVTHVVAGVGTGGTICGVGRALHDRGDVTVVGYEPAREDHFLQGLKYLRTGDHRHPDVYDESVLDRKLYVETSDAWRAASDLRTAHGDHVPVADPGRRDVGTVREHLRVDGEFRVGPTGGGSVAAVRTLHDAGELDADDVVVAMLPDRGDVYPGTRWAGDPRA